MRRLRRRGSFLGVACALLATGVAAAVFLAFSPSSSAGPTRARFLAEVAAICRAYGPKLDRIRPPDVAEPANVIAAINRVLPLVTAQQRRVRSLDAPPELRSDLARWFRLQDRRIAMLAEAVAAGKRQDFRTMSVAYVDFALAGSAIGKLGSAIGIPHPPC
jgi:hypothetical protein